MISFKKITAGMLASALISGAVFADNFFTSRFFEIKTNIQLGMSNNVFAFSDVFQKEIVIDLRQIADNMPANGLNTKFHANPTSGFKLNIPRIFSLEVMSGVDVYGNMDIGKSLFDFLGYGNELGEAVSADVNFYADGFFVESLGVTVGNKIKIAVTPSVFAPLFHVESDNANVTVKNSEDGKIDMNMNAGLSLYSPLGFVGGEFNKDSLNVSEFCNGMGFDLGAALTYPVLRNLMITGSVRIPVVPGSISYRTSMSYSMEMHTSVDEIANGTEPDFITKSSADDTVKLSGDDIYKINRPLKAFVSADFRPFGDFFQIFGGIGFGWRNPFLKNGNTDRYMDYLAGVKISLLDILCASVSTECTDQIFIHRVGATVNVRLVQVDFGISSESSDLGKSLKGTGLGGYVTFYVGF